MERQRGFVLIIGLLIGTIILAIVFASYGGFLGKSTERIPNIGGPGQTAQQGQKVVMYEIKDIETGEIKTGSLGLVPYEVDGHRIHLVESDYETYAAMFVEDFEDVGSETVILGKGEEYKVDGKIFQITGFVSN